MVNVKSKYMLKLLIFFSFLKNVFKKGYRSISALSITSAYSFKNIFFAIIYQGNFSDKNNN